MRSMVEGAYGEGRLVWKPPSDRPAACHLPVPGRILFFIPNDRDRRIDAQHRMDWTGGRRRFQPFALGCVILPRHPDRKSVV